MGYNIQAQNMSKDRGPTQSKVERREARRAAARAAASATETRTPSGIVLPRRTFIIGGISALTVGAGFLAWINQPRSEAATENEIAARLKDLDTRIVRNPNILADTAAEIAEMATYSFHQETGRRIIDTKSTLLFYTDPQVFIRDATRCSRFPVDANVGARADKDTQKIHFNLALALSGGNPGRISPNAAVNTYTDIKHEIAHLTAPIRPATQDITAFFGVPSDFQVSGLRVEKDQPDGCYLTILDTRVFEEVVIQAEVERSVNILPGYINYRSPAYRSAVDDFRTQIIIPFFSQDPNNLLQYQGTADPLGFYEEIGRRSQPRASTSPNKNVAMQTLKPFLEKHRSNF